MWESQHWVSQCPAPSNRDIAKACTMGWPGYLRLRRGGDTTAWTQSMTFHNRRRVQTHRATHHPATRKKMQVNLDESINYNIQIFNICTYVYMDACMSRINSTAISNKMHRWIIKNDSSGYAGISGSSISAYKSHQQSMQVSHTATPPWSSHGHRWL